MTLGLCLLTLNERVGCQHDIPLIDRSQFEQVFCIDGGSQDGTVEFLRSQNIKVYQQSKKGINQACIDGVDKCNCDAIIFFHPKGTIPVGDLYKFRAFFEQGVEFVVGSRMMRESVNEEDCKLIKPRKWFVLFISFLAKALFKKEGDTIWDSLHGFRGIRVDAFKRMKISNFDPSIDIEMVCRAYKLHISRIEFPTKEQARIAGKTHFKALSSGKRMLQYVWWEMGRKE